MAIFIHLDADPAGPRRIRVEGSLTVREGREDLGALTRLLASPRETRFDLTALSEIDIAGAQMLLAFARESEKAGARVRVDAHGAVSLGAFEALGLPLDLDVALVGRDGK